MDTVTWRAENGRWRYVDGLLVFFFFLFVLGHCFYGITRACLWLALGDLEEQGPKA